MANPIEIKVITPRNDKEEREIFIRLARNISYLRSLSITRTDLYILLLDREFIGAMYEECRMYGRNLMKLNLVTSESPTLVVNDQDSMFMSLQRYFGSLSEIESLAILEDLHKVATRSIDPKFLSY